jgi:hypothetical protein
LIALTITRRHHQPVIAPRRQQAETEHVNVHLSGRRFFVGVRDQPCS